MFRWSGNAPIGKVYSYIYLSYSKIPKCWFFSLNLSKNCVNWRSFVRSFGISISFPLSLQEKRRPKRQEKNYGKKAKHALLHFYCGFLVQIQTENGNRPTEERKNPIFVCDYNRAYQHNNGNDDDNLSLPCVSLIYWADMSFFCLFILLK